MSIRKSTIHILILGAMVGATAIPAEDRATLPGKKPRISRSLSANETQELKQKVDTLSNEMERLGAEMEVLRHQHKIMIQRTNVGFLDGFYMKAGLALVLPRTRTFNFRTDTGLGAFAGLGQYFGRNHVADLSFDWDMYPSLSLRYRFEIHSESPHITWGPVIGIKVKMANLRPFDNFLDNPDEVASRFYMFGAMVGFPMGRSLVTLEFLYLTNTQAIFMTNVGMHFFM